MGEGQDTHAWWMAVLATVLAVPTAAAVVIAVVTGTAASAGAFEAGTPRPAEPAAVRVVEAGDPRPLGEGGDAADPGGGPAPFTLAELDAGTVSSQAHAAFWAVEAARVRSAACPAVAGGGATVVTVFVGATPPPHLGPDYVDQAPAMAAALADRDARCS